MNTQTAEGWERIVVTGVGAVTPLGLSVPETVDNLMAGRDGIVSVRDTILDGYPQLNVWVAATVPDFNLQDSPELASVINPKDQRRIHRSAQFSLWASLEALKQADLLGPDLKIDPSKVDPRRVGISMGTGVGGADVVADTSKRINEEKDGKRFLRVWPYYVLNVLPERVATVPSRIFGVTGPVRTVIAACATGNMNLIEAAQMLMLDRVDVALAGGTEAQLTPEGMALFDGLKDALDPSHDPRQASRPFHAESNGFVMGEGAGALVLETLKHAQRRGATILAELVGFGEGSDAAHDTTPTGEGTRAALEMALGRYALRDGIYVNAHATGTGGDLIELEAVAEVLKPEKVVGLSSTKGATGHTLGAAGAVEAIFVVEAIRRGKVPPSLKMSDNPLRETADWRMSPDTATESDIEIGVNNSIGFGGENAVTVFKRWDK